MADQGSRYKQFFQVNLLNVIQQVILLKILRGISTKLVSTFANNFAKLKYLDFRGLTFSEGLLAVNRTEEPVLCSSFGQCRVGYMDKTGKMAIAPKFSAAKNFSEGLAAVALFGDHEGHSPVFWSWVYIDKTGKVIIPTEFRDAKSFSEGLAPVMIGDKWGYISR